MMELARPFVLLWNYVSEVGGFPGQVFFGIAVVMAVVGVLTWYGNRK
jgi:hypothetical protein